MKRLKKPWVIPVLLTILILAAGIIFTKQFITKAEAMPEGKVRQQLEAMYGGQVKEIALNGLIYEAEFMHDRGIYEVEVDAETGKVLSLVQTNKETSVESTPSNNEILANKETVLITEKQAMNIALARQKGEVDDVEFVQTESGGYYIVEIEVDNDVRGDEVFFQIHAISGKIISVTWDD